MGYRKIWNLYQDLRILEFKECYAMEKIHGTSAHVRWSNGNVMLHSGGAKHETFAALFDATDLSERFTDLGHPDVCVYGEACGGKIMKMRHAYGEELRFVAFEVTVGESWLDVPDAADVAAKMGLDFVPYERGPATVEWLNEQRDRPSQFAIRLGLGEQAREGIVIRPIHEITDKRGNRIITKHKGADFCEHKKPREIDPAAIKAIEDAVAIAEDWVVPNRLDHVLDKMPEKGRMEHTGLVIRAMIEDIKAESDGEIVWSPAVEKQIAAATAKLYKAKVTAIPSEVA